MLAPIVGVDQLSLENRLADAEQRVRVRRAQGRRRHRERRCKALGLTGILFVPESKRFYPSDRLAAPVLGFVGTDNNGLGGLEYLYERHAARARRASCRSSATRRATRSRVASTG